MRKEYHKLVRDRIPEIIEGEGKAFEVRVLDEAACRQALRRKVVEEARVIAEAPEEEPAREIPDLYEVLDAVVSAYGLSGEVIRAVQARRRRKRGGFDGRVELLWVE